MLVWNNNKHDFLCFIWFQVSLLPTCAITSIFTKCSFVGWEKYLFCNSSNMINIGLFSTCSLFMLDKVIYTYSAIYMYMWNDRLGKWQYVNNVSKNISTLLVVWSLWRIFTQNSNKLPQHYKSIICHTQLGLDDHIVYTNACIIHVMVLSISLYWSRGIGHKQRHPLLEHVPTLHATVRWPL